MRRFISLRGRERIYTFTFSEVNDPRKGTERTLCTGHEESICEKKVIRSLEGKSQWLHLLLLFSLPLVYAYHTDGISPLPYSLLLKTKKQKAKQGGMCLQSQHWRGTNRQIPGTLLQWVSDPWETLSNKTKVCDSTKEDKTKQLHVWSRWNYDM